ncbi:class I SAM-dependent methyltransferase [Cerasicoccus arenae]|nr:class I SAM-dependent methyltransferase [Cerasicoccus arenae]MBK1858872.1 methyltransferase domain-containing protein [Cerasicoccus arenae]
MNSLAGKKALSLVRKADFAHPGDVEAIEMVFKKLPRQPDTKVLDIGSGLGGTSEHIRAEGWGKVTGIDINRSSIVYANETYKRCNFVHGDVVDAPLILEHGFEVLVSFTAFYAFKDPGAALKALSQIASPNSSLTIFDYVDRGDYQQHPIMEGDQRFLPNPLHLDKVEGLLAANGWRLFTIEPLHPHFADWYLALIEKIKGAEDKIRKSTPEGFYEHMLSLYTQLYNSIHENHLGGAIIRAVHGKAQL